MAQIHRLPDPNPDDRRSIDVTAGELVEMVVERLMQRLGDQEPEAPLGVKELGRLYGVADDRVREWIGEGMPCIRTGDVRGIRIWPDKARAWLEVNRA
jgi:hypothetical protein